MERVYKMKILLLALTMICSIVEAMSVEQKKEILVQLSQERYFPYQDIIVNNEVLTRGVGPDCPSRYEAIKSVLDKYQRPIKVLDIGASNGYFSLRIAHDFEALCVMADLSDRLLNICKLNNEVDGLVYLKKALSLEDLKMLNEQEHFDVVLALNVVHHMSPCKEILDILFELGDTVIIETPPANDTRSDDNPDVPFIEEYLVNKAHGTIIAQTPRADANNFEQIKSLGGDEDYLAQKEYIPGAFAKMFCFENVPTVVKSPSFKLSTFALLNGVYPSSNTLNDQGQYDYEIVLKKSIKKKISLDELDNFPDPIIISLGYSCTVADMLRSNNLRCLAFPFDWTRSSFQGIYDLLSNDFLDLLNPEYLSFETTFILNKKYTIAFHHDFPAERTVGRADYLKENYLDYVSDVATKYQRRVNRLNRALNSGHAIYCIRLSSGTRPWNLDSLKQSREEVIKLKDLLLNKFPQSNFTLVAIDNDDSYKNDWNLEHIKNFYIHNPASNDEWVAIFKNLGFLTSNS